MLQVRRAQSVILLFWILNWLSCQHLNCPANSVDFFKTENNLKWPTRHISFYSFISMVGQNPMQLWERVPDWEWLRFFFSSLGPRCVSIFSICLPSFTISARSRFRLRIWRKRPKEEETKTFCSSWFSSLISSGAFRIPFLYRPLLFFVTKIARVFLAK